MTTGAFLPDGTGGVADPSRPSLAHKEMTPRWHMLRTLMRGTEAMREAGELYLPKFAAEDDTIYKSRLNKTVLTNFFEDAVRNTASLPFKKPVTVTEGPHWVDGFIQDVDMMGSDLTEFGRAVLEDAIIAGYSFILCDHMRVEASNLAEERALGGRPYWSHVKADDMVAIQTQRIGGAEMVVHARFREDYYRMVGYVEHKIERIRELNPGSYRLWERGIHTNGWQLIEEGPMTFPVVPIVPVIAGRIEHDWVVKPLFMDLAYKQVEHWVSSSDQRNILTFARFPMLAVAGVGEGDGEIAVGPNKVLQTTDPAGKWYFVEPAGRAIEMGKKDLDTLKDEMRVLGLQPVLGQNTGSVTATSRALDETRVHSAVQVLALNLETALTRAMQFTGLWMQDPFFGKLTVNRDFGMSLRDTSELDALIRARVAGEISRLTFWSELKRRNVLSPDFNEDLELELLTAEQEALFGAPMGLSDFNATNMSLNNTGVVNDKNTFRELSG